MAMVGVLTLYILLTIKLEIKNTRKGMALLYIASLVNLLASLAVLSPLPLPFLVFFISSFNCK